MTITTPLCDVLGIDHPIVQAPIGSATRSGLAATVSNAGGLGTLAVTWRQPEEAAVEDLYRERVVDDRRDRDVPGRPVRRRLEGDAAPDAPQQHRRGLGGRRPAGVGRG